MSRRPQSAFEAMAPLREDLPSMGGVSLCEENASFDHDLNPTSFQLNWDQDLNPPKVIRESEFYPNTNVNIHYDSDSITLGLLEGEMIMVKGQYQLKIIFGSITIDDIEIESSVINIHSSSITSLPLIKSIGDENGTFSFKGLNGDFNTIIQLSNKDLGLSSIGTIQQHLKHVYNSNSKQYSFKLITNPEQNIYGNTLPDSWTNTINHLLKSKAKKNANKVLILGNKNTGKSTLTKMLLNNTIMCKGKGQVLDIDPGQSEFTYPLTLSFSRLSSPVFGTIISDLIVRDKHYVEFYGFNTPAISPLTYFLHLKNLIAKDDAQLDTVINNPGWTKGFGVDIVKFIINNMNLTHIILLNERNRGLDFLRELDFPPNIDVINLPAMSFDEFNTNSNTIPPSTIRNFKILCPLHKIPHQSLFDFNPLVDRSPVQLSFLHGTKALDTINAFNGLVFVSVLDSNGIVAEDLIECLETQIVGLHTIKTKTLESQLGNISNDVTFSSNAPLLLPEHNLYTLNPQFEAYCCVHSVDCINHIINVYTSDLRENLTQELLGGESKLVLIVGRCTIPSEEVQLRRWNGGLVPYSAPSVGVVGSKPVSIRRTVQRGRLY